MKINEAKILVTGGGRGIGQFLALGLMEKASKVIVIENNKQLIADLIKIHPSLLVFEGDITDAVVVEEIIREIFEKHGGVNVCINNAGIIHSEPLVNLLSKTDKKHSLTNWKKVIDLNLNAVF